MSSSGLTPDERVATGHALADVHNWAGSAWRSLGSSVPPPTRANVLAAVDELVKRLEEVRMLLGGPELPSAGEPRSRILGGRP